MIKKTFIMFLAIITFLFVCSVSCFAWEQPAHKKINEAAVNTFGKVYSKTSKYKSAYVDLNALVDTPQVTVS
jgi:hypothetical protein